MVVLALGLWVALCSIGVVVSLLVLWWQWGRQDELLVVVGC